MTTAQEPLNCHHSFPPPCSVPAPAELDRADLPTDKDNVSSEPLESPISDLQSPDAAAPFPASAYHVPPKRRTPKAHAYRFDDSSPGGIDTTPSPERCQFMFSDGRQCTMGRYEVHPSLCRYHYEREEQLFGPPGCIGAVLARELDLPELYSACRDLSNPSGVHRALAQVFRLLAQRRISRQEAATFAKLGHLLLQSISTACAEFVASPGSTGIVERQKGVAITPLLPHEEVQVVERQKDVAITPLLPHEEVQVGAWGSVADELPVSSLENVAVRVRSSGSETQDRQPLRNSCQQPPPQRKVSIRSDSEAPSPSAPTAHASPPEPEAAVAPPDIQRPHNQHLRKAGEQLAQNQHIRNAAP